MRYETPKLVQTDSQTWIWCTQVRPFPISLRLRGNGCCISSESKLSKPTHVVKFSSVLVHCCKCSRQLSTFSIQVLGARSCKHKELVIGLVTQVHSQTADSSNILNVALLSMWQNVSLGDSTFCEWSNWSFQLTQVMVGYRNQPLWYHRVILHVPGCPMFHQRLLQELLWKESIRSVCFGQLGILVGNTPGGEPPLHQAKVNFDTS